VTELGEKFLAALVDQGYGFVFTDEDLRILGANHRSQHHVPVVILEQAVYEFLLVAAIRAFAELDGRFNTDPVFGEGRGSN
jgi:hypothetical protein